MEITGKIIAVLDLQSGTSSRGNAWQKRDCVIETQEQYPKKMCFTLFGDKVNMCPQVGETCTVCFDIDAHEYNGRWFNQINAWKVDRPSAQQPQMAAAVAPQGATGQWQQPAPQPQQATPQPVQQPQTQGASSSEDLPF